MKNNLFGLAGLLAIAAYATKRLIDVASFNAESQDKLRASQALVAVRDAASIQEERDLAASFEDRRLAMQEAQTAAYLIRSNFDIETMIREMSGGTPFTAQDDGAVLCRDVCAPDCLDCDVDSTLEFLRANNAISIPGLAPDASLSDLSTLAEAILSKSPAPSQEGDDGVWILFFGPEGEA